MVKAPHLVRAAANLTAGGTSVSASLTGGGGGHVRCRSTISHPYCCDGSRIVGGCIDHIARVWDAVSGELVLELKGHNGIVGIASFSPDGNRIITGSMDGTIRIWDTVTGEAYLVLEMNSGSPHDATFSPDGNKVLAAGHDVMIWNSAPWNFNEYPGDDSMTFMQRYNLWSVEQHENFKKLKD